MANPFEIRAKLLEQAQNLLQMQYQAAAEFNRDLLVFSSQRAIQGLEQFQKTIPTFPTAAEVVAKATEFLNFVDGNK